MPDVRSIHASLLEIADRVLDEAVNLSFGGFERRIEVFQGGSIEIRDADFNELLSGSQNSLDIEVEDRFLHLSVPDPLRILHRGKVYDALANTREARQLAEGVEHFLQHGESLMLVWNSKSVCPIFAIKSFQECFSLSFRLNSVDSYFFTKH
jgi:hypothetical protein